MDTILFLCTGNYYRSRYAEIIFNWFASPLDCNWNAISRGLDLKKGINNTGPLSSTAADRIKQKGIPFSDAMSRMPVQVDISDLNKSKLIIALQKSEHRPYINMLFPEWENRITFWNVADVQPDLLYDPLIEIENNVIALINELIRN